MGEPFMVNSMICPFCHRKFNHIRELSIHFSRTEYKRFKTNLDKESCLWETCFGKKRLHNIIRKYKNEKICTNEIREKYACPKKLLNLLKIKRTSKEERKTARYKKRYLSGIRKKYGKNITNLSASPIIQKKKERTLAKKYGSYNKYLEVCRKRMLIGSKKYRKTSKYKKDIDRMEETCLRKYGHRNFGAGNVAILKRIKTIKKLWASRSYEEKIKRTEAPRRAGHFKKFRNWISKPERKIEKALKILGVKYCHNVFLWRFNFDFLLQKKIVIEVQGDYWHACKEKYKANDIICGDLKAKDVWKKDRYKRKLASKNGYKIIEIWEHEIKNKTGKQICELIKTKLMKNKFYKKGN
jgi:G:T-mismatch repair DNA endonuclease (very short patch repair protein)